MPTPQIRLNSAITGLQPDDPNNPAQNDMGGLFSQSVQQSEDTLQGDNLNRENLMATASNPMAVESLVNSGFQDRMGQAESQFNPQWSAFYQAMKNKGATVGAKRGINPLPMLGLQGS